ncbi:outer membrane protein assembly factor BamB family protein [Parapedobacter lycopersici]|uniref:outer membrane protein assembly factor BamB family protein n=1 Tax=Parapedobacter lycopersici TaxID=1864939 RepID=UPI00214DC84D|nr:PQQ-binding-like beta-propeller repeat protein [Parapedobacter lycopersici]
MNKYISNLLMAGSVFAACCACNRGQNLHFAGWETAGGNATGNKYSALTQIDTGNVHLLTVAWEYHTGDADTAAGSQIQCNPIMVDGVLYGTSPQLNLFAIDAATGREKWVYAPFGEDADRPADFGLNNNRGVAYWSDDAGNSRIFYCAGPFLHAVDAKTGKPVETFGVHGRKDLHDGLGADFADLFITNTSPPSVYKNLVISGTRVSEAMDAAPGHIRAYDVRTGEIAWTFRTIPRAGEPGSETWDDQEMLKWTGGGNNWMGMTIDHDRGIIYAPTGSAAMDFYGGKRTGSNLYTDCLLALDAATGELRWYFQYIHHNTWDWDPSSAPVLLTVNHNGTEIDAVAQTTKTGFVFLFDRETGKSLFPISETPVDTVTELVGEKLWPTQPIPQKPAPFVRQSFTEKDINPHLSEEEYEEVRQRLRSYKSDGLFTPQSRQGTVIFPGFDGGAEWGGPAVDPTTGMLYVNANEMAWVMEMWDVDEAEQKTVTYGEAGRALYQQHCMACHGADRKGSGNYPSLAGVAERYTPKAFTEFIGAGRGMMPAFRHLEAEEQAAITAYVLGAGPAADMPFEKRKPTPIEAFRRIPYNISGYNRFLSTSGKPAIAPPWGTLNAIDLHTGELVWKTVLGEDAELQSRGVETTGTENYGGPAVTAGGLLFIGATKDGKFRAFHKRTGALLWETALPAAGFATPAIYEVNGKQYVVIACGGGKLGAKSGDSYVAFALPE